MKKAKPKAFIFDVFGTLVDWRTGIATASQTLFAEKGITLDPLEFADQWRAQYQPSMQKIRSANRGYVPLEDLHLENLETVLAENNLYEHFSSEEKRRLNQGWERLPTWPDVKEGLLELRRNALIAPCSNGSIALMTRIARYNDLHWDCILGAEIAQNYKPEAQVYHASCKALGLSPSEVMMIAAHNDDLFAARMAGLQTGFIPRICEHGKDQTKDLEAEGNWDFIGETISSFGGVF